MKNSRQVCSVKDVTTFVFSSWKKEIRTGKFFVPESTHTLTPAVFYSLFFNSIVNLIAAIRILIDYFQVKIFIV